MSAAFSIPAEYQDQLKPVDTAAIDKRTNDEILRSLAQHAPVTSEKNLWAFWDSGLSNMPAWCQRNIVDWVRICAPLGWTIRVLDNVPSSPNYTLKYVSRELLPDAFVDRKMDGPYIGPHSADFLRGALLYEHGGVYMDVGCILIRDMDRICWNEISDPNSPVHIVVPLMYGQVIANHFVASRKGDPFIKRWHDLFTHLWKNHTNHQGLIENPLLAFGANLTFEESRASNFNWDFKVDAKTVMEYISQVLCWTRLTMLEEAGDGFSCAEYWEKNVMCFDVLQESWGAESVVGFASGGQGMFNPLSMKVDGDKNAEEYKQAEKMVWRMLAGSSIQKITHGKGLTNNLALGAIWDMPENEGKDCARGTFAELLRYGTVHFRQTRGSVVKLEAKPAQQKMKKGVFEP
ncbi:capsule polysaccharide biosynthesis [Favolaschia claudopus]|uniref:Capsule polysaccharide biosynthesis n=1 Tax=Favolaschia claudopus TaxID=2862362 RepID=A0AAW0B927_9AGAR